MPAFDIEVLAFGNLTPVYRVYESDAWSVFPNHCFGDYTQISSADKIMK